MATFTPNRAVFQPLSELLPKNEAGDAAFEHIVSVLLRFDTSRTHGQGKNITPIHLGRGLWLSERTLCVCWLPSQSDGDKYDRPLSLANEQLKRLGTGDQPTRLVVAEPHAVANTEASTSDAFQQYVAAMRKMLPQECTMTCWDAVHLRDMLLAIPPLGLRYYPEFLPNGPERRQALTMASQHYDQEVAKLHGKIQFVGMSVYKEEASASVDMDQIYIPLRVVPEGAVESEARVTRTDPLRLLTPGARHVILGDPGSGKSTLLHFLALAGSQSQLMQRYRTHKDDRLPVLVTLRRYADELKSRPDLSLR